MKEFQHKSTMPVDAGTLFEWHTRPGAFERLQPPWQTVDMIRSDHGIRDGAEVLLALRKSVFSLKWHLRHQDYRPGEQFRDVQIKGPFRHWSHTHRFEPVSDEASILTEDIRYIPPPVLPVDRLIRRQLRNLFIFRHMRTFRDLQLHKRYASGSRMRVLVSGSSGMLGSQLVPFLRTGGHEVVRLVRHPEPDDPDTLFWQPSQNRLETGQLENFDVIIHLGGVNLASWPWTRSTKSAIMESRRVSTSLLSEAIARLKHPPSVFICASGASIYGDRGDEELPEDSDRGSGFLADVVMQWEAACQPARDAGIRVANLRFGVILSPESGALKKMLPAFRTGAGAVVGSGEQYFPWVSLDDVIAAVYHTIHTQELNGPVNVVSPVAVDNRRFSKALGRALNRPVMVRIPSWVIRMTFGEMGAETLLPSTRVIPRKLEKSGFTFLYPQPEDALRFVLGKMTSPEGEKSQELEK